MRAMPVRFACFDIGSNAIRFIISEYADESHSKTIYKHREPIRLTPSVDSKGMLNEEAMQAVIKFFKENHRIMQQYQVHSYKAIATSAVRESKNGKKLCAAVQKEALLTLQIISMEEEARFVYTAVKNKINLQNKNWYLLDIGGGSVQVSVINQNEMIFTKSSPIGAVRLWERFQDKMNSGSALAAFIESEYKHMNIPDHQINRSLSGCIATGGSVEAIAGLVEMITHKRTFGVLSIKQIKEIRDLLFSMNYEERIEKLNLSKDRADIILPAVVLVDQFCKQVDLSSLIVPNISLRDGIILELAQQYFSQLRNEPE